MSNKQAGIDLPTILKLFTGGALLGGGLGVGTSLYRRLQALQEEADRANNTSFDDNTLYLDLPRPAGAPGTKRADDASSAGTFALGGLGAASGLYAAYNLVRGLYAKAEKKRLQRQLDEAQRVYLGNLGQQVELQKGAAQFSLMTKGVGSAYLAGLLTALGSAVATNHILKKQFPAHAAPERNRPKKLVLRTVERPDDPQAEVAQVEPTDQMSPEAVEAVLQSHLGSGKQAAHSGFADLVAAVAQGRAAEVKETLIKFAGCAKAQPQGPGELDLLFALVKGAAQTPVSALAQELAVNWLVHDPLVSRALAPTLAAEYYEMSPGWCKLAAHQAPGVQAALLRLAETVTQARRVETFAPVLARLPSWKEAAALLGDMGEPLQQLVLADNLKNLLAPPGPEKEETESGPRPDEVNGESGKTSPDPSRPRLEIQDAAAQQVASRISPLLDNVLRRI
jgi:hypothetical protein